MERPAGGSGEQQQFALAACAAVERVVAPPTSREMVFRTQPAENAVRLPVPRIRLAAARAVTSPSPRHRARVEVREAALDAGLGRNWSAFAAGVKDWR